MIYLGSIPGGMELYRARDILDFKNNKERDISEKGNVYIIFEELTLKPISPYNLQAKDKTGTLTLAKTDLLKNYDIVEGE